MAKNILIGCRLPHGLIIEHPATPEVKVEIQGLNKSRIVGAPYTTTLVDGEFWQAWKLFHEKHPCLASGAIFEAKDTASAEAVSRELEKVKTGFEAMPQEAPGLKKLDDEE